MAQKRVAAVVVTFNRAPKLKKVLESLNLQTRRPDRIYVIDNASTDNTRDVVDALENPDIRYLRLSENLGGAGGFNFGMKAAYADGFDLLWISDDDAYPHEDALEKLITSLEVFAEKTTHWPSFACSAVKFTDGSWCEMNTPTTTWDWPRHYTPDAPYFLVGSCSFVSVLIPRWAVREHGFPIKDYFIWYDDAEYTQRLARSYPGIFVPDSVVTHDTGVNMGVNYGMITDTNIWKFKFGARNETCFRLREKGLAGVLSFAYSVRQQMKAGNVPIKTRFTIYNQIIKGCWFRPKIEPIIAKDTAI